MSQSAMNSRKPISYNAIETGLIAREGTGIARCYYLNLRGFFRPVSKASITIFSSEGNFLTENKLTT